MAERTGAGLLGLAVAGAASPASVAAACEMAQSAVQAVENLEHAYGIPVGKIAVTPMIGVNDRPARLRLAEP